MVTLKDFMELTSETTQYTVLNENGDCVDFFTVNYLADFETFKDAIEKATNYAFNCNAVVTHFETLNDVLRVKIKI